MPVMRPIFLYRAGLDGRPLPLDFPLASKETPA
jgi:hypothetical protein